MKIVPLHRTPTQKEAQKIVRELTEKGTVFLSKHAKKRMRQRNINMQQVLVCLAKGRVTECPVLANKGGDTAGYDITVERLAAGEYLRVGVCLRLNQTVLVVTVIKEK